MTGSRCIGNSAFRPLPYDQIYAVFVGFASAMTQMGNIVVDHFFSSAVMSCKVASFTETGAAIYEMLPGAFHDIFSLTKKDETLV